MAEVRPSNLSSSIDAGSWRSMTATSRPAPAQAMPSSIPTNPPPATTSSASSAISGGWVCRRALSSALLPRDPCRLALCRASLMYNALRSGRSRRAAVLGSANRSMNIHEYQAKELLAKFGLPVPPGGVAYTAAEAVEGARRLGGEPSGTKAWAVKAQIHAGGRGKAGGVKLVRSEDEVAAAARELIGKNLVTHQTSPEGRVVKRVYVEAASNIARELYLALSVDRGSGRITIIGAAEGGMDIEELAERSPDKVVKEAIDPAAGLTPFYARRLGFAFGLTAAQVNKLVEFTAALYRAFTELDAALVEINPLVLTGEGDLVALDAKLGFDDNALFRHPDVEALRDEDEEDPIELEAGKHALNYVKLDGNIGCMVNGAGLAMATMDIIKLFGGEPANFLDVGGGATKDRVTIAFKLILSDPNVEAILVNIFGGIMRCDVIAEGIVAAAREVNLHVPLVVRLEGTNVELGRKLLGQSGLPLIAAENFEDAAKKVVDVVKEAA